MTQTTSSWVRLTAVVVLLAACLLVPFALAQRAGHGTPGAVTTSLTVPELCPGVAGQITFTATDGGTGIPKSAGTVALQSTTVVSPTARDWKRVTSTYDATTGNGTAKVSGALPLAYRVVVTPTTGSEVDGTPATVGTPGTTFAACVPAVAFPSPPATLRVGQVTTVTGTVYHPDFTSPSYTGVGSAGWAPYSGPTVQIVLAATNSTTGKVTTSILGKGVAGSDGTFSIGVKAPKLAAGVTSTTLSAVVPASAATGPAASSTASAVTVVDPSAPTGAIATPASAATWYTGEQVTITGSFTAQGTAQVPVGARVTVKVGSTTLTSNPAAVVAAGGGWTLTAVVPASAKSGTLTASSAAVAGLASAGTATGPAITVAPRTVVGISDSLTPASPTHGAGFLVTGIVKVSGSTAVATQGVGVVVYKENADGTLARTAAVTDTTDVDGSFVLRFTAAKSVAGDYVVLAKKGATWIATAYDPAHPSTSSLFTFTVN